MVVTERFSVQDRIQQRIDLRGILAVVSTRSASIAAPCSSVRVINHITVKKRREVFIILVKSVSLFLTCCLMPLLGVLVHQTANVVLYIGIDIDSCSRALEVAGHCRGRCCGSSVFRSARRSGVTACIIACVRVTHLGGLVTTVCVYPGNFVCATSSNNLRTNGKATRCFAIFLYFVHICHILSLLLYFCSCFKCG